MESSDNGEFNAELIHCQRGFIRTSETNSNNFIQWFSFFSFRFHWKISKLSYIHLKCTECECECEWNKILFILKCKGIIDWASEYWILISEEFHVRSYQEMPKKQKIKQISKSWMHPMALQTLRMEHGFYTIILSGHKFDMPINSNWFREMIQSKVFL